jgi:ABC-type Zn2+ transport system substrate-binding protein/surface adhesin
MNRIRRITVAAAIAGLTSLGTVGVALAGDYGDSGGGDDSDDGHHKKHDDSDDSDDHKSNSSSRHGDDDDSSEVSMPPMGDGSLAHLGD